MNAKTSDKVSDKVSDELLARCAILSGMSSMEDGICRVYLSDEHRAANAQTLEWMRAAGMTAEVDAVGSVRGRYPGATPDAPVLLIGSHLDTVPDAGAYDGILGVMLGISAVETLHAVGRKLPFAIEVIGFGEEEGVRFGTTLMTSRAVAGSWDNRWWDLEDEAGISLRAAFARFDLDPEALGHASLKGTDVLGYVELHIEQGPVLEASDLPLGVVTAIAGAKRLQVRVEGSAGHAGTTPMNMRRDALVAASRAVARAEEIATNFGVVATVGQIGCEPGGVNVIPRTAEFSLDIRSGDDERRESALTEFLAELRHDCAERGLEVSIEETHAAAAVPCADKLQNLLAQAVVDVGVAEKRLPSGAGHDAMAMAELCDVAMLFIRSPGGISHNPAESVIASDVQLAHDALLAFMERLARDT